MSVVITPKAIKKFKSILLNKKLPYKSAIRFKVNTGGCYGFEYSISIEKPSAFEMPTRADTTLIIENLRVIIDDQSLELMKDTQIDIAETDFEYKFVYSNPNAKGNCGCGVSFTT